MKKIIIAILIMTLTASSQDVFAHNPHSDNDSIQMSTTMKHQIEVQQQTESVNAFPNYHPLIVHFPIVLLLMALVFQLLSLFFYKKEFSITTLILLALGVITTWLASNPFHAMPGELAGRAKEIFDTHELMAIYTWWFSLTALIVKTASVFFFKRKFFTEILTTLLLVGSAITVSIAGHHGAMLVHIEGVGPLGKYLDEYRLPEKTSDSNSLNMTVPQSGSTDEQDEDHHVGEIGKGPHGGTVEEADPDHIEIAAEGDNLIFYLLDGDAKPLDMKNITGSVKMQYADKSSKIIDLVDMNGRKAALKANNGKEFTAICTLAQNGKSYSGTFISNKDLPNNK